MTSRAGGCGRGGPGWDAAQPAQPAGIAVSLSTTTTHGSRDSFSIASARNASPSRSASSRGATALGRSADSAWLRLLISACGSEPVRNHALPAASAISRAIVLLPVPDSPRRMTVRTHP